MQNKTFRLFISSPFSDFKKERDVLHKRVFPKIDKFCNENGFSFQPIDLRWGVSAEAQLDQKTLEVCLEEVRACKHFPYPNFLIMAGDRYGYIPLPYMIEKTEFDKIKQIYLNDKEKISINYEAIKDEKSDVLSQKAPKNITKTELLDEWYKLDENQIPISYILKPRIDEYKEYSNWKINQEYLRTILQNAANILFEDKENKEYLKYFTSATEAEVLEGILEYKDITQTQEKLLENKIVENSKVDKEYVYGYIRTIENPNGQYIDFIEDNENKEFLKQKAIDFKTNLSNTLDKDKNILTSAYDSIELYEENQLIEFEEFIYEKLINAIKTQKNKSDEISSIDKEIIEQEKFKNDKQKGFIGRENTLNKIENYVLNDKTNEPLVIYGISGMGKSSLMARAINNTSKLVDKDNLIYRFVGATQNSTTIKSLLISICDELSNKNIIEKIKEYESEDYKFFKQINEILSNIEKSVVLFIDALDQLQFKDSLQWLPKNSLNSFKIVLSVLNDEKYKEDSYYYNILKNSVTSNNLIDVSNDSLESSKEFLIENLLFDLDRKIDDYQTNYLLNKWKETNYSPLYLKIAIEELKHWKSGDKTQELESSVEGIVKEYIKNLTKIYHHEEILVNKVFGYIHASNDGLSEKELLEILSEDLEDEILMKEKIINEYHKPIKVKNPRRENKEELILPMSIWSRLHTQIKPFIIQRNIDNQPLMKFFHRQFTSVIDDLIKDNKIQLHTKLSKYFYSLQDKSKTWNEKYHNLHMLNEYPYQLFHSKQSQELKEILFDLEFAGSVYDNNKQENFRDIMSKATQLENITEDEIYPWKSFYREKEHLILKVNNELRKSHQSLFQIAYEDGIDSPLYKKAELILINDKVNWYWLKNILKKDHFYRNGLIEWFQIKEYYIPYTIKNVILLENNDLIITMKNFRHDIEDKYYVEKFGFFYKNNLNNECYLKKREEIKNYSHKIIKGNFFYSNKDIYSTNILSISVENDKLIIYDKLKNKAKYIYIDGFSIEGFKILSNNLLLIAFSQLSFGIFDTNSINEIVTRKDYFELDKLYKFKNLLITLQNKNLILFDLIKEKITYEYCVSNYKIEYFSFINHSLIIFWTIDSIHLLNINTNELKLIYNLKVPISDHITVKENNKLFWLENNDLLYLNIIDFKFKEFSINIDEFYQSEEYSDGSISYKNSIIISQDESVKWDIFGFYYKYTFNGVSYDFNVTHGDPQYNEIKTIEFKTGESIIFDPNSDQIEFYSKDEFSYKQILNINFYLKPGKEVKDDTIFLFLENKVFPFKLFFGNTDITSNNVIIDEINNHNSRIQGYYPSLSYRNQKFNLDTNL